MSDSHVKPLLSCRFRTKSTVSSARQPAAPPIKNPSSLKPGLKLFFDETFDGYVKLSNKYTFYSKERINLLILQVVCGQFGSSWISKFNDTYILFTKQGNYLFIRAQCCSQKFLWKLTLLIWLKINRWLRMVKISLSSRFLHSRFNKKW